MPSLSSTKSFNETRGEAHPYYIIRNRISGFPFPESTNPSALASFAQRRILVQCMVHGACAMQCAPHAQSGGVAFPPKGRLTFLFPTRLSTLFEFVCLQLGSLHTPTYIHYSAYIRLGVGAIQPSGAIGIRCSIPNSF